jgi:hypothetical protein
VQSVASVTEGEEPKAIGAQWACSRLKQADRPIDN